MNTLWLESIEEFERVLEDIEREIASDILFESQLALERDMEEYLLNDRLKKERNYE